jgi:hypothetical protein
MLGASVGIIGAAAYQCVAPRLIGPAWFRRATVALAAGAVVGSMLIHSDGVDFRVLKPTWLAIGMFIALPALFGAAIAVAVDRISAAHSRGVEAPLRRVLPVVLVVMFPITVILLGFAAVVYAGWQQLRDQPAIRSLGSVRSVGYLVQACWLVVAVVGLFALIGDIRSLSALPL